MKTGPEQSNFPQAPAIFLHESALEYYFTCEFLLTLNIL